MADNKSITEVQEKSIISPEMLKLQKSLSEGKSVIGIDIGVTSVNVAQTVMYRGKQVLIKTAIEEIHPENERSRDKATTAALKKVMSGFNTKRADVICVMPSRQTQVENFIMPLMPQEEIKGAVDFEVKSSQYFTIEKPILDFKLSGRTVENDVEKLNVTVAATGKASVDALLAKFTPRQTKLMAGEVKPVKPPASVGVELNVVVPVAIALENIIKRSQSESHSEEIMATIDMGTFATELNIYHNAQLVLSRQIPVTGSDLTRRLTSALFTESGKLELTMGEAEAIKKEYGIPVPGENYLINKKITAAQMLSLLRPGLEQLTSEVGRVFDYFQETIHGGKIDRVVLFGGGAKLKGLSEFMNAELGLPVEIGDPLLGVDVLCPEVIEDKEDVQRLVEAIGASLGDPQGINLLPLYLKERKKRSLEIFLVLAFLLLVIGISAGIYVVVDSAMKSAQVKAEEAKKEYQSLFPQLQALKDGLVLKQYVRARPDLGNVLKYFSYLPSNVYLMDMSIKGSKVSLSGLVTGTEKEIKAYPGRLVSELGKGILRNVKNIPVKESLRRKGIVFFKIEGTIIPGGGVQ